MNQRGRRIIYLLFGLAPAFLGAAFSFFLGPLMLVALAGTFGLFIATAAEFPVPRKRYWLLACLLLCGLALALPFGAAMLHGVLTKGATTKDLPAMTLIFWVFVCPSVCALHALWRGRCAPNNSFKPKPLRGSA
jgi:hypothetical protein